MEFFKKSCKIVNKRVKYHRKRLKKAAEKKRSFFLDRYNIEKKPIVVKGQTA